jgi:hypothetical protein
LQVVTERLACRRPRAARAAQAQEIEESTMLRKLWCGIVLCVMAAGLAFAAEGGAPDSETQAASHHGWGFRVGYLKIDDSVAKRVLGKPNDYLTDLPTMKSSGLVGAFYYVDASRGMRVEIRMSMAPTKIQHVCPDVHVSQTGADPQTESCVFNEKDAKAKVLYWDLVFLPHWKLTRGSFEVGVPFGVGWAVTTAPKDFAPSSELVSRSGDVAFSTGSGMTYFLGLQPIWNLRSGKRIFFEARALRFHRLVNYNSATVHTVEITAGMSFPLGRGKKKAKTPETPPESAPQTPPPRNK